jgi:hypothetical protein
LSADVPGSPHTRPCTAQGLFVCACRRLIKSFCRMTESSTLSVEIYLMARTRTGHSLPDVLVILGTHGLLITLLAFTVNRMCQSLSEAPGPVKSKLASR